MATSPLFGWEEPDDTDLVKDGAAAIRTLGNAIDTSMGDLLGGTSGQILAKASNTNMDFTWITNDVGDITAVTAGTGISGGGSSGDVTITNSMATAIDAKGDLIAGTGADAFSRIAAGANGTTLIADSTAATGLKWAKSPNFVGCILYKNANQSVANSTGTAITYDTEFIDTDSFHDNSTNPSRITIPTGLDGKYQINATVVWDANGTGVRYLNIYKNGFLIGQLQGINPNGSFDQPVTGSMIFFGVAGDYFEAWGFQTSGGALNAKGGGSFATSILSAQFLGA